MFPHLMHVCIWNYGWWLCFFMQTSHHSETYPPLCLHTLATNKSRLPQKWLDHSLDYTEHQQSSLLAHQIAHAFDVALTESGFEYMTAGFNSQTKTHKTICMWWYPFSFWLCWVSNVRLLVLKFATQNLQMMFHANPEGIRANTSSVSCDPQ